MLHSSELDGLAASASEAELRRNFDQLEALYRMSSAVSRSLSLDRIYEEALSCLRQALEADRAAVLLFDRRGVMRIKTSYGLSEEYRQAVEGHSPWKPDAVDAQAFGVSDVAEEMEADRLRDTILAEGIRACAFIPMLHAGELLGKFMIYYDQPHRFPDEELRLAHAIATQTALAIVRVRAEEVLRKRERQYKTLADNIPQVIARLTRQGRYIYINPAIQQFAGLAPAQVMGRPIEQITPQPEIAALWRRRLAQAFESGDIVKFGYTLPTPSGVRNFSTQLVPETDMAGTVTSVISITEDVTERVQAEERHRFLAEVSTRLVESPDYQATLQNLAQLMSESLADACAIDEANDDNSLRRICLVNSSPGESVDPAFPTAVDSEFANLALRTGKSQLHAHGMCVPLNARGRTLGVITLASSPRNRSYNQGDVRFAEEVAQRAALVIDNARLYQEARDASMAKSAFLATMSHELRTPLNAILGYAELMELGVGGGVSEQQRQQIARINASAWHLLSIIEEILTFSRVEAGREEVHLERVDVKVLMEEAGSMIEPAADRKDLAFVLVTPPDGTTLRTDRGKLRQILLNLMSNAVKFTSAGRIECVCDVDGYTVQFRISDTGPGIPAAYHERIFEPFWQETQGATRKAGGTGLGLTVSRQLARLLGGDVTIDPSCVDGAAFIVTVPDHSE